MTKADYSAPGLLIADAEAAIATATGLSVSVAGELARIDQAITLAGLAACTWQGRGFRWSRRKRQFLTSTFTVATIANNGAVRSSSNVATITTTAAHGLAVDQDVYISGCSDSTFDGYHHIVSVTTTAFTSLNIGDAVGNTTAGNGTVYLISYPVRTVQSNALTDFYAAYGVFIDDDYPLAPMSKAAYDAFYAVNPTQSEPYRYCLYGDDNGLFMGLVPAPDKARLITVDYIRRHSAVTSAGSNDAALIVPTEAKWGVYVLGATWLIKHETIDPASLSQCPGFVGAMEVLAQVESMAPDDTENMYPGSQGYLPNDRRVIEDSLGTIIVNPGSL